MKVLCLGHATFDTTLPVEGYPVENKKYRIKKNIECGGGPASNAAYLLGKWNVDTSFAGIVGNDYYGQRVIEEFNSVGVDTTYLETDATNTSSSYIIANTLNGSRTIITSKTTKSKQIDKKIKLDDVELILVDGEHVNTAVEVLERKKDVISILDAGTYKESTKKLGYLVKYLASSKNFAEDFVGYKITDDNIVEVYKKLEDEFKTTIIITLESKGAFVKIDNQYKLIPSIKVKAVDSTGAGDIFHGALAYFLLNKYPLEKAIGLANISGALSVEKIGSRYAMPELSQVLEVGKDNGIL